MTFGNLIILYYDDTTKLLIVFFNKHVYMRTYCHKHLHSAVVKIQMPPPPLIPTCTCGYLACFWVIYNWQIIVLVVS